MPKPFFDRLQIYFTNVGKVLRGEADIASIFPNPSDIGTSRESIYAEVLRQHLPKSCVVSLGGFLFDVEGSESKQIDLIMLNDVSPQFNFHNPDGNGKAFACIDGCVAVASIKSSLDSNQLTDSLNNLASLPEKAPLEGRHNPLIKIPTYNDWPYKIIYASDGVTINTALNTLNQFYKDNNHIPINKRPNMIHVCGKYNIVRVGKNATTRDGQQLDENTYWGNPDTSDAYALVATIFFIQKILFASYQVMIDYSGLVDKLPLENNTKLVGE